MHDAVQWGTLILVGFGIMLSRYDFNTVRKEMREEINGLRKEIREENAAFRKEVRDEIASVRASLERQTTTINTMIFGHTERIAKLETKLGGKP